MTDRSRKHRTRSLIVVSLAAMLVLPLGLPAGGRDIRWTHQFGTSAFDSAQAISATASGIYVAGQTSGTLPGQTSAGGDDAFVRKYNPDGTVAWTDQFGTSERDVAWAVSATSSEIYVAGQTNGAFPGQTSAGGRDAFVRKYKPNGTVLWTDQFGTSELDIAWAVSATSSGIYVAGGTDGALPGQTSAGEADAFVRKYDPDGTLAWTRQFGTTEPEWAGAISATSSGIYVSGTTDGALPGQTSAGGADAFVRKYDPDGTLAWTRQFGTTELDWASAISATPSGIYVAGDTEGVLPGQTSAGGRDAFVRKYNPNGTLAWTRQFGTSERDEASAVSATSSGLYVAGWTEGALPGQTSAGGRDAFVRRYKPNGRVAWTRQFGTPAFDRAAAVSATAAGVFAAGTTNGALPGQTSAGGTDAFVMRLAGYRPDALISLRRARGYAGNDIYNRTGNRQVRTARVKRGRAKTFFVRGQNDGDARDAFRVKGCRSGRGFRVRYLAGSTNVTRRVVRGTYRMATMAPGAHRLLRVRIEVRPRAEPGTLKRCRVLLTSVNDSTKRDAVRAQVRARR